LQVGHVERFNSAFTTIEPIVQNPLFIECHRLNLFPNRSLDIGVVMDLMIHDIDIILGLVKSPIKDIQAVGITVLTDKEDIANVRLTFANGCVCNVTASRISPEVTRKIRLFTKNAYISLDYAKQEANMYTKDETGIHKRSIPIEKEEPLKKELESFLDCVREDLRPKVSGVEGRQALKVALDINKKIWEHRQSIS
jgi:predicted dehydrogenase